jgi:hypothetical protein
MRSLIHEQPHEKPVASGRYRYERQGQATGAAESWRLSDVDDGYHFLRVDLNRQETERGSSVLYHLTIGPAGRPERLSFRFFKGARTISGNVLFEDELVTSARNVDEARLGLLPATVKGTAPAVTLNEDEQFALHTTEVTVTNSTVERVTVMGQSVPARRVTVRGAGHEWLIWLDAHDWPVRVQSDDLTAVETRLLRYRDETDG